MAALKSTIVLITGANQGIGFASARKLAREQPGYHILMGSRGAQRGSEAATKLLAEGLSVEAITIDVNSDASIAAAAELVSSKFGRLDVLINNAGIAIDHEYKPGGSIRDVMMATYNTNVFGAMQTFETFVPLLEKSALPRVVFLSSSLGSLNLNAVPGEYPIYRSTKSAINSLMLAYAEKYREKGWKINATCPGFLATNLNNYGGRGKVEDGAINTSRLAVLGEDGETGTYSNKEGPIPW